MLTFETSPLWRSTKEIIDSGTKPVFFNILAQLHFDQTTIDVFKVLSIDDFRNYEENFADDVNITVQIPLGIWVKDIYPNRHKLEMTITKIPIKENNDTIDVNKEPIVERFKAVSNKKSNTSLESTDYGAYSKETLNKLDLPEITFQLQNKSIEKLRLLEIGGPLRKCTPTQVITTCLNNYSQSVKINGKNSIDFVDMVAANNTSVREHFIIPHGTPLISLPSLVQAKMGGVYSGDIGLYFQNKGWWVYPLFDTTRFNTDTRRKLVLIKVPSSKFTNIERTFLLNGDIISIIGTGDVQYKDDGDAEFLNSGSGYRYTDSDSIADNSYATTKNNKTTITRSKTTTEAVMLQRSDGINHAPVVGISNNPYHLASKTVARNGGVLIFQWHNCDTQLLIPGMSVQYMYMDNDTLVQVNGVLLASRSFTQQESPGFTNNKYVSNAVLTIFVKKVVK